MYRNPGIHASIIPQTAANLTVLFLTDPGGLLFLDPGGLILFLGLKMFWALPWKRETGFVSSAACSGWMVSKWLTKYLLTSLVEWVRRSSR